MFNQYNGINKTLSAVYQPINSLKEAIEGQKNNILEGKNNYCSISIVNLLAGFSIPENHYPHISKIDNKMVCYFRDQNKLVSDISTRIKAAKYLNLLNDTQKLLTEKEIKNRCDNFIVAQRDDQRYQLQIAEGEEEITRVYKSDIYSCMNDETKYFQAYIDNVCRVYDTPDFTLYYMVDKTDIHNNIVARTLVNNNTNCFIKIYCLDAVEHRSTFIKLLNDKNIQDDNDTIGFKNCLIKKIVSSYDNNYYCVPYIDGKHDHLYDYDEDYMIINDDYDGNGRQYTDGATTEGYSDLEDTRQLCSHCGDLEEITTYIDNDYFTGVICNHCLRANFTLAIVDQYSNKDYIPLDDSITDSWDNIYHIDVIDQHCVYSELSESYIINEYAIYSDYHQDYIEKDNSSIVEIKNYDNSEEEDHVILSKVDIDHLYVIDDNELLLAIDNDFDDIRKDPDYADRKIKTIVDHNREAIDQKIDNIFKVIEILHDDILNEILFRKYYTHRLNDSLRRIYKNTNYINYITGHTDRAYILNILRRDYVKYNPFQRLIIV